MRKARFTEHQIIVVVKPGEVGRTVKDVCRPESWNRALKDVIEKGYKTSDKA